jgi:hypothetical protein
MMARDEFVSSILVRLHAVASGFSDIDDKVKAIEGIVALHQGLGIKFAPAGTPSPQHITYGIFEDKDRLGVWCVGATDDDSEGETYTASFSGYNARARATEYAEWKTGYVKSGDGGISTGPAS